MADAESRRNARRQKLLQNAEKRMNKLLGNVSLQQEPAEAVKELECSRLEKNSGLSDDDAKAASYKKTEPHVLSQESGSFESDVSIHEPAAPEPSLLRQRLSTPSTLEHQQVSGSQQISSSSKNDKALAASHVNKSTSNVGDGDSKEAVTVAAPPPDPIKAFDQVRCGGCLLAAFITRLVFSYGLGILFFELVLLPFVVLETAFYIFHTTHMKDIQLPHKNTVMTYALVLSGIKPELITKYNTIMGYFAALIEDLAVYLFSFLVFNCIME